MLKKAKVGILISAIICILMILGACGSDTPAAQPTTQQSTVQQPASTDEPVNLTLWHYYTATAPHLQSVIDSFNSQQNGVYVQLEFVPFADISRQLSIGLAGNVLPDLAIIDTVATANFANIGVLKDITDTVQASGEFEHFLEGPRGANRLNGRYFGIPVEANALGFFYNTDIFDAVGIQALPETWNELLEVSARVLEHDSSLIPVGITAVRNEQSTFHFIPFLYSAGGTFDNLASPEAARTLTFFKELMDNGYMSPDFINQNQDDIIQRFIAGQVAMMINGPWAVPRLEDVNFNVGLVPRDVRHASVLGGANMVAVDGANADAAMEVINFFLQRSTVEAFAEGASLLPIRTDMMAEPRWQQDPSAMFFSGNLAVAVPRGPSPHWPQVSENIQIAIQSALLGQQTPEDALAQAAAANAGF